MSRINADGPGQSERKKLRLLLESNNANANRNIASLSQLKDSIISFAQTTYLELDSDEAYRQHVEEEEERVAREQYEMLKAIEEEDMLELAMSCMKIHSNNSGSSSPTKSTQRKMTVPCPICIVGALQLTPDRILSCDHCNATCRETGYSSLQQVFDRFEFMFQSHSDSSCLGQSKIVVNSLGEWVFVCQDCRLEVKVFQ